MSTDGYKYGVTQGKGNTMRNRKGRWKRRWFQGNGYAIAKARDVNITNVTNVTNVTEVTNVMQVNGHNWERKPRRHDGYKKRDRPPKLYRFCASGGLLDQDVVASMDTGKLASEAVKVTGYMAKKVGASAMDIGRDIGSGVKHAAEVAGSLFGIIGDFIRAWE